jgi:hypothetical protein
MIKIIVLLCVYVAWHTLAILNIMDDLEKLREQRTNCECKNDQPR